MFIPTTSKHNFVCEKSKSRQKFHNDSASHTLIDSAGTLPNTILEISDNSKPSSPIRVNELRQPRAYSHLVSSKDFLHFPSSWSSRPEYLKIQQSSKRNEKPFTIVYHTIRSRMRRLWLGNYDGECRRLWERTLRMNLPHWRHLSRRERPVGNLRSRRSDLLPQHRRSTLSQSESAFILGTFHVE